MNPTTGNHYHALSIGVHWLTLALLVAVYALIEFRGVFPKGTNAHDAMKTWHEMLGLTVFVLTFGRLALRWLFRAPPITPAPPAWQHFLAKSMHVALYAFLLVMPVLGWLMLSAKGKVIPFFGLELTPLLAPDKALAHQIEGIHETIGNIGYWLIGLHATAALFHHYLMRDDTLVRMLPHRRARTPVIRDKRGGAVREPAA
ncbi:MAG: cytochrome b [Rhodanobacteraceae bacterium]|nr:MAG: cytochrome b [Rhodanobacteraceae bacterium]